MREEFRGSGQSYKIDYGAVAGKSRCVAETINITFNINNLCWSGRRDSNPRPSAPKADALPGCATPRHQHRLYRESALAREAARFRGRSTLGAATTQHDRKCKNQPQHHCHARQKQPVGTSVGTRGAHVKLQQVVITAVRFPCNQENVAEMGTAPTRTPMPMLTAMRTSVT
jgi:hypothetical protein